MWQNLRNRCNTERRRLEGKRSGEAVDHTSTWVHYQAMGFLQRHVVPRRTHGNMATRAIVTVRPAEEPSTSLWDTPVFTPAYTPLEDEGPAEDDPAEGQPAEDMAEEDEDMAAAGPGERFVDTDVEEGSQTPSNSRKRRAVSASANNSRMIRGPSNRQPLNRGGPTVVPRAVSVRRREGNQRLKKMVEGAIQNLSSFLSTAVEEPPKRLSVNEALAQSIVASLDNIKSPMMAARARVELLQVLEKYAEC